MSTKTKSYISSDVTSTGRDFLRQAIGTVWTKQTGSYATPPPTADELPPGVTYNSEYSFYDASSTTQLSIPESSEPDYREIDVLKADIMVADGDTENKYIVLDKLEVNPSRITKVSEDTIIPSAKIPVRIFANPDYAKSDHFWQTVFMGGEYNRTIYPKLVDNMSVFYDFAFDYTLSGDIMKMKESLSGYDEYGETTLTNIRCNYPDHNNYIANYQAWAVNQHELLLPNINFEANFRAYAIGTAEVMTQAVLDVYAELRNEDKNYMKLWEYYYPKELGGYLRFTEEGAEEIIQTDEWYGKSWIYNWSAPEDLKQDVINAQKNIMFANDYFADIGIDMGSTVRELESRSAYYKQSANMANIEISFMRDYDRSESAHTTRRPADADPMTSKNINWVFRNSIENKNFSAKFLEMLKDIDSGNLSDLKMKKMPLASDTEQLLTTLDPLTGTSLGSYTERTTENIKLQTFDYLEFLFYTFNRFDDAINNDYTFLNRAANTPRYLQTYDDNLMYRFSNTQDVSSVIDTTLDSLNDYLDVFSQDYLESHIDPETGAGTPEIQRQVYKYFLNADTKFHETLAYKIEKYGGEVTGDSKTQNNIQNFWIFNSSLDDPAGKPFNLIDTQVKYGQKYTYVGYAYVAVIGHKYKYTDFRLTKQTNNYDTDDDGFIDKYCVQFYEPLSLQVRPQIFAISSNPERNPSGAQYSNLSEYNTFAPSQYDISEAPQLAEFYLNIEPCVKIIKIPIFHKTVGVYDNPPNKLTSVPFHVINDENKIGFNIIQDNFKEAPFPTSFSVSEDILKEKYLNAKDLYPTDYIKQYSESPARYLEVYRMKKKPNSYYDFNQHLVSKIDLRIPDEKYNRSDYIFGDRIKSNEKYYYLFRFISENGMHGHPSTIVEAELVDDGGYKYAKFNTFDTSKFNESSYTGKSKTFKKLLQIEPNINQLLLSSTEADFTKNATTQIANVEIGQKGEKIWDKKFKIRLTSKKSGKKIDLNVTFNIQDRDFS